MNLTFQNVNEAFYNLVQGISDGSLNLSESESRNGPVLYFPDPVVVTIENPEERVLLNPERDCNPFFHLYESLWMLAGDNRVKPLAYYASNMEEFSDDGVFLNGAYGRRWRKRNDYHMNEVSGIETPGGIAQGYTDQLVEVIEHLKDHPNSRRAVVSMWNVEEDLLRIDNRRDMFSKDVCCNTQLMFSIRQEPNGEGEFDSNGDPVPKSLTTYDVLDMTVVNRSNDLIWGMLGANVVHMSFLQEWMARKIGVLVGKMHTMTNNLHVYKWNWEPIKWLGGYEEEHRVYPYIRVPIDIDDDREILNFVGSHHHTNGIISTRLWHSEFLNDVAQPMMNSFHCHKVKAYNEELTWIEEVKDEAWRKAGIAWYERRTERRNSK